MALHTPMCDLLGIEYPIFAAGMGGVTMAPLTAAISAAGGCGVLGATFCTPDQLRAADPGCRRWRQARRNRPPPRSPPSVVPS